MGINPGGQLSVEEIVGREHEIERYWTVLERQSLVLNAERRIGKTSILHKMGVRGREGFHTYYQELERVHGITELISQIYRTVSADLPRAPSGSRRPPSRPGWRCRRTDSKSSRCRLRATRGRRSSKMRSRTSCTPSRTTSGSSSCGTSFR